MKSFKKKVSKILLSFTMVFAMALTIMPTNVFAATTYNYSSLKAGDILVKGDIVYNDTSNLTSFFHSLIPEMRYPIASGASLTLKDGEHNTFEITFANIALGYVTFETYNQGEVLINGGTGSGIFKQDDIVTITANTPATGKQFKEWTVVSGGITLADPTSANTTFTMPAEDVELTATYEDIPPMVKDVTVNSGTSDKTEYAKDETVTITANAPATGKQFKEWTVVSGGVTLANSKRVTTTFTMPDNAVEVTATYEDVVTPPTPEKPVITAGTGSTHQISDGKDMTFTCSGKLEDLTGVYVDGKLVDESNYTLKSGSTILTLKSSYLDTLSAGKHTLKFQYKDNVSAETDFTITAKVGETPAKPSSPKTGDNSSTMLYLGLIVLSGCVAGFGLKKKKYLNK